MSRAGPKTLEAIQPDHFRIYQELLSPSEQYKLLQCALKKLDDVRGVSRAIKRRRKELGVVCSPTTFSGEVSRAFLSADCYEFDQGHYDGVIRDYRESHISSWPDDVQPILGKVISLMPGAPPLSSVQTHVLHLSATGEILPHIDNVEASGNVILGISLGATRMLRLQHKELRDTRESIDVRLESGSVYVQSDSVRYNFVHSISLPLIEGTAGQRVSIMIRDLLKGKSPYLS
ncbi:hypothetical protein FRB99_006906 [Tulasnella sp. 403]|nr:hypothetical protein FRB99_006906 [Tulasnella sp. 403]